MAKINLTDQQVVDKVYAHLKKQGKRAWTEETGCIYRLKVDGKIMKCAVGALIPKKLYSNKIEGRNASNLNYDLGFELFDKNQIGLLGNLQRMHDDWTGGPFETTEPRFKEICAKYNLTYPGDSHTI